MLWVRVCLSVTKMRILVGFNSYEINEDQLHNFTVLPDAVGGPFNPLLIGETGWNRALENDGQDQTESGRVNKTVTLEDINCVISQNLD